MDGTRLPPRLAGRLKPSTSFEDESRRGSRYGCSRNHLALLSTGLSPVSYSSAWMRTLSGGVQDHGFGRSKGSIHNHVLKAIPTLRHTPWAERTAAT
ncbi:hypothetical protein FA13DRAFT_1741310, partial [Coprinellus micaceus]